MMYQTFAHRLCWLFFAASVVLLASCGGDLSVDEFTFRCNPDQKDSCGAGYVCRSVPKQSFSACYKLGEEPEDAGTLDSGDAEHKQDGGETGIQDAREDIEESCPSSTVFCDGKCIGANTEESVCDGTDNNCNGVVDEGCACDYLNKSAGVCKNSVRDRDGVCKRPAAYRPAEFACARTTTGETRADGEDNDCDGLVDEVTATDIATGSKHACLLFNGRAYCWGLYHSETNPQTSHEPTPLALPHIDTQYVKLTAGDDHTCALSLSGVAYCWSVGDEDQSGDTFITTLEPHRIGAPSPIFFDEIAAGGHHTCGITHGKKIQCWGEDDMGQLGTGSLERKEMDAPVDVDWPMGAGEPRHLGLGRSHSCATSVAGALYCWGNNDAWQLGTGEGAPTMVTTPARVGTTSFFNHVDGGEAHSCGLDAASNAHCWGRDTFGLLGNGTGVSHSAVPDMIDGLTFSRVRTGGAHSCAIEDSTSKRAYCWGHNEFGAVGSGTGGAEHPAPVQVETAVGFASLDVGDHFTCGIGTDDNVYCWGVGLDGQLGNGGTQGSAVPTAVRCAAP